MADKKNEDASAFDVLIRTRDWNSKEDKRSEDIDLEFLQVRIAERSESPVVPQVDRVLALLTFRIEEGNPSLYVEHIASVSCREELLSEEEL